MANTAWGLPMQPRFRLRTSLVVVAGVAVLLGAERTRRRWESYRQQSAFHGGRQFQSERKARLVKAELNRQQRMVLGNRCGNIYQYWKALGNLATSEAANAAYHARLSEEYRHRW